MNIMVIIQGSSKHTMPAHYYRLHFQIACDITVVINGCQNSISFLWLYESISLNGYNGKKWGFERTTLNPLNIFYTW